MAVENKGGENAAANRVAFNISVLAFFASTCHMLSEYVREASVLALVFIPLDLWKHSEITTLRLANLVALSLVVLGGGMFLQYVSLLCERVKRHLEEE